MHLSSSVTGHLEEWRVQAMRSEVTGCTRQPGEDLGFGYKPPEGTLTQLRLEKDHASYFCSGE